MKVKTKLSKSEQMSRVRSKGTQPEIVFEALLLENHLKYSKHPGLPGSPDFVLPALNLIVFIDGCFWHACPDHFTLPKHNRAFWEQKIHQNVLRDTKMNERLERMGWKVARVWSHQLKKDTIDATLDRLNLVSPRHTLQIS